MSLKAPGELPWWLYVAVLLGIAAVMLIIVASDLGVK